MRSASGGTWVRVDPLRLCSSIPPKKKKKKKEEEKKKKKKKKKWFVDILSGLLPLTINETLKWLSSLPPHFSANIILVVTM